MGRVKCLANMEKKYTKCRECKNDCNRGFIRVDNESEAVDMDLLLKVILVFSLVILMLLLCGVFYMTCRKQRALKEVEMKKPKRRSNSVVERTLIPHATTISAVEFEIREDEVIR